MLQRILYLSVIIIFLSCKSNVSLTKSKQEIYQYQEFDINTFKGKWLTRSKWDKSHYSIFHENFYVENSDKRYVPYKLNKDSIYIYYNNMTAKGRLLDLTHKRVTIIWGDSETITYYRP